MLSVYVDTKIVPGLQVFADVLNPIEFLPMIPLINPTSPLIFNAGDTIYGVEISEAWGTTTQAIASATIVVESIPELGKIPPFNGSVAVVMQTTTTTTFTFSWPNSPALPAGRYLVYFQWLAAGGAIGSTNGIYVEVAL